MIRKCWVRASALVVLALAAGGCASRGNEVLRSQDAATVNLNIVDGRTTQQEVQSLYGTPLKKHFISEKNEVWTYAWARATAQGQNFIPIVGPLVRGFDVRKKELIVVFNENNVVARHAMTDINDTVKTGLIDPGASPSPAPASTSLPASRPASTPTSAPPTSAPASSLTATPPAPPPPVATPASPPAATGGVERDCIRSDGMRMRVPGSVCPPQTTPAS